jgi:hypothetical protein
MTTMAATAVPSNRRILIVAALAAKAAVLLLLLSSALIWPDLSGIKGKASTARLIVYPIGAMVLPLWWFAIGWTRSRLHQTFPRHADLLITLPWLIDLIGNRLNLFDTITWWDDLMHLLLWALLTAGVLTAFAPRGLSRVLTTMVALGFGATAAVIWEVGEYLAFVRHSSELQTRRTPTPSATSPSAPWALSWPASPSSRYDAPEAASPIRTTAGGGSSLHCQAGKPARHRGGIPLGRFLVSLVVREPVGAEPHPDAPGRHQRSVRSRIARSQKPKG